MSPSLKTFAKVRALHDGTTHPAERAAAASQMRQLAKKAGLTVEQAKSKLDTPRAPVPPSPAQAAADMFNAFFNSPEMMASRAKREAERRVKAAAIIEAMGSEEALLEDTPMEAALRRACEPLLGPDETWQTSYRLDGWDGFGTEKMPASVRTAVSEAWPLPEAVAAAWAEYQAIEKLTDDRYAVEYYYTPHSFLDARRYVIEELCNTLPARSLNDLRARISWLEFWANSEVEQDPQSHRTTIASLRADVERMAVQIRHPASAEFSAAGANSDPDAPQDVQSGRTQDCVGSPVQSGHQQGCPHCGYPSCRTNADKRRDVLNLLGDSAGQTGSVRLSDREIARRAGVSPQTVGNIRRSL